MADADVDRRVKEFRDLLDDAHGYARDFMPRQPVFAFGGLWRGLGWAGDDWTREDRGSRRRAAGSHRRHAADACRTSIPTPR